MLSISNVETVLGFKWILKWHVRRCCMILNFFNLFFREPGGVNGAKLNCPSPSASDALGNPKISERVSFKNVFIVVCLTDDSSKCTRFNCVFWGVFGCFQFCCHLTYLSFRHL